MANSIALEEIQLDDLPTRVQQIVLSSVPGQPPGRLLRFKDAVLARAEVNRNNDELDEAGLRQVAASLPLLAIDVDHRLRTVCGYYTDARVLDDEVPQALGCDGLIFADRFPEVATGIQDGSYLLSIEADAAQATCSVCGRVFASEIQYCEHLRNRRAQGARRKLSGLRAVGGAVTHNPAGTNTTFDRTKLQIIASLHHGQTADEQQDVPAAGSDGQAKGSEPANHPTVSSAALHTPPVRDLDSCLPNEPGPKGQRPGPRQVLTFLTEAEFRLSTLFGKALTSEERNVLDDSAFGLIQERDGKKIRRFPLHDCEHARKALQLLPQAAAVSPSEATEIKRKAYAKLADQDCAPAGTASSVVPNKAHCALNGAFTFLLQHFDAVAAPKDGRGGGLWARFEALEPANPGAHLQLSSPVLSPVLWVVTPAWVDQLTNGERRPTEPRVESKPSGHESVRSEDDQDSIAGEHKAATSTADAAPPAVTSQELEALKHELLARLEGLFGQLHSAAPPNDPSVRPGPGLSGIAWDVTKPSPPARVQATW